MSSSEPKPATAADKARRKNLITVECPAEVDGLAVLLNTTREDFVKTAIHERIGNLRTLAQTVGGSTPSLGFAPPT